MSTTWIGKNGISQCCIQRFLAVANIDAAKKAVWIFVFGLSIIKLVSCFGGLIIYTFYETCDPLASGKIEKFDQILPFFIMQTASDYPGLPGLFIAGVFSAALSSISSTLNTTAGTIYEDFIRPCFPNASEKRASDVMKIFVVILGIVMLSLVFIVDKMGQIFRLNFVISGMFVGTQLGLFSIGMMSRTANTKGVICGAIVALLSVGTIIIGAQSLPKQPPLNFKTEGCNFTLSSTKNDTDSYQDDLKNIPLIFQLSFMYYTIFAVIILFVVAIPISWLTGGCKPFDERLITPFLRKQDWEKNITETKQALYKKLNLKSTIEMNKIDESAKPNKN